MLITAHTVIGFTIGVVSGNPYVAAPLAFASHYLFDGLPHFEVSSFRKPEERELKPKNLFEALFVFADLVLAAVILFLFRAHWSEASLLGSLFAVLPDFLDNVFLWSGFFHRLPLFDRLYSFHKSFHWTARGKDIFLGMVVQLFVILGCILIILAV
ncbi:hypothetical protein J7K05_00220 [bacterium]|nr:hypothetical protein [bacterium]